MAKALVTSENFEEQTLPLPPVADDEIEPEAMAEIIRRVEQLRRGESTLYSNEEVLKDLPPNLLRIVEALDDLQ